MGNRWLRVAALVLFASSIAPHEARAGDPLKPYVVLSLDTSGSMDDPTGSGPPSCGGTDTRLNHARCAINRIVNSYGDMVFALGRFRMSTSGTYPSCSLSGAGSPGTSTCNGTANMFELLTPLVDGNNDAAALWTDGTYNTCTGNGSDPEVWGASGNTPLAGALVGAKQYFLGLQAPSFTIWDPGQPGFDPIANDPTRTAFLPSGCNPSPTCTTNCCAKQCRPYIVILLTDGAETCTAFSDTTAAAGSLLRTDRTTSAPSMLRRYRVETKPIGFGISPGDANIEAIAHAGGAPDVPAVNEGFYAANENELQLAISSILADAIKTETCNNLDDDCDTAIDEDFPDKGQVCDNGKLGVCRRTGALVCRADGTGLSCNAPAGPSGTTEVCNNLDDDCDGKTDEGLTGCICSPQGEQCDNLDNDCDGTIDEGISRPCGTGTCRGVETCSAGGWVGCTAQQPLPEVCNGLDDNCDGIRDGFSEACSTMPPLPPENYPVDDPRNNPGDPSNNPIPENICRPGIKTCPANVGPPNQFGACLGEQQPLTEVCNGLDDDCDNLIDEAPPVACTTNAQCPPITPTCDNPTAAPNAGQCRPADCSSNCGVGSLVCVNGALQCNAMPAPDDDSCDGNDDDCDGVVDEDFVGGPCTGSPPVCNGMEQCVNGAVVCSGGPIAQESCNCLDDNCNNQVDEGSLCPAGAECVSCQCAFRCGPGEFPCPLGKICKDEFCITDVCFGVTCPDVGGDKQVCRPDPAQPNMAQCISACDPAVQQCPSPLICHGPSGECRPDDCTTFPERCGPGEDCIAGQCVSNPCQGVTCGAGQYCVGGNCVNSCADVECPNGQRCRLGMCETDPCGAPCPFPKVCNDATGTCVNDPCVPVQCPQGQECNPNQGGQCQDSGCIGTVCPNPGESCHLGTCDRPSGPDADVEVRVTTGGGGGCAAGGEAGGLSGLVGLALLAVLRRRREVRS